MNKNHHLFQVVVFFVYLSVKYLMLLLLFLFAGSYKSVAKVESTEKTIKKVIFHHDLAHDERIADLIVIQPLNIDVAVENHKTKGWIVVVFKSFYC